MQDQASVQLQDKIDRLFSTNRNQFDQVYSNVTSLLEDVKSMFGEKDRKSGKIIDGQ